MDNFFRNRLFAHIYELLDTVAYGNSLDASESELFPDFPWKFRVPVGAVKPTMLSMLLLQEEEVYKVLQ
jgi:hypothetical protein